MTTKIKTLFILWISAYLICCTKSNEITKVNIRYVDLEIFTSINVNCDKFEGYFEPDIKTVELPQKSIIEFSKALSDFVKRTKIYKKGIPDVRFKITLSLNDGSTETLCIGNNLVSYKGIVYENDDKFRAYLENIVKKP